MPPMAIIGSKARTPEETAAIVSATAIAKAKDVAQAAIVRLLGRGRPFVKVHVGLTDVNLGSGPQERQGYTVLALYSFGTASVATASLQAVSDWLKACHGSKHEQSPAKPVVAAGSKTLYVAVAYAS